MKYFLAKSDPEEYGIEDLEKDKIAPWDGVRNAQAVIFLKQMQAGDRVLIYHSQGQTRRLRNASTSQAIVGLAEVVGKSGADPKDPKSWLVNFKFIRKFQKPYVTLRQIKETGLFPKEAGFRLTYQSRLSTMPVPEIFLNWFKKQPGVNLS